MSEITQEDFESWRDSILVMFALGVKRTLEQGAKPLADHLQQKLDQGEDFTDDEITHVQNLARISEEIHAMLLEFFSLRDLEKEHQQGSPTALLVAATLAASRGEPAPKWAAVALARKVIAVTSYQAQSWDDVFGRPHKPRTDFDAIQDFHRKALPMYFEITRQEAAGVGTTKAIEDAASKYGTSYGTARGWYYRIKKSGFPFHMLEPFNPGSIFSG